MKCPKCGADIESNQLVPDFCDLYVNYIGSKIGMTSIKVMVSQLVGGVVILDGCTHLIMDIFFLMLRVFVILVKQF